MAARIAYNMKDEVSAEAALQMITKRDPSSSRSPKPADSATPDSQARSDSPAVLCGMVRSLAMGAYRVLRRTSEENAIDPLPEILELLNRIDQLEQQMKDFRQHRTCMLEGLQSWLSSLRRRVQVRLRQSDGWPAE